MKKYIIKGRIFLNKLKFDDIGTHSAECAYYTILSFVPFIIFFMTLIQFTVIEEEFVFNLIKQVVPSTMHNFVFNIIEEVYSKSLNTISFSILIALWSASKGFYALCKGLKRIYKLSEKKSNIIVRIEGLIYTLLFIITILLVMILIVFGNRIHQFIAKNFFSLGIISAFILKIRIFIIIGALFLVFVLVYKFVPRHKMSFKSQIPGAAFSAISWVFMSYIFSIYIDIFKGFSNTYGSLSSIVLVMIWIYVCMYIILLGAEINIFIKENKYKLFKEISKN